jgi:hypothetical protein
LVNAVGSFTTDPVTRGTQVDQFVGSAVWSHLIDSRNSAASADAACRRTAHDLAFTALLQPLQTYQAQHRDEIEQRRAQWEAVETRANNTPDPVPHT